MEEITKELILKAPTPQNGETQTIRRQQPTNGWSATILWGWRLKG